MEVLEKCVHHVPPLVGEFQVELEVIYCGMSFATNARFLQSVNLSLVHMYIIAAQIRTHILKSCTNLLTYVDGYLFFLRGGTQGQSIF